MQAASDRLLEIVHTPSREIRLAEASLILAQEQYPALDIGQYLEYLDDYAESVIKTLPSSPSLGDMVFSLNTTLFDELGFVGQLNETNTPGNCFLNRVIDRKRGVPITLAVIYMEVGRSLGMEMEGIFFPGHFLIRLHSLDHEFIIDPLSGGLSVMEDELGSLMKQAYGKDGITISSMKRFLVPSDDREVLVYMLRGLKTLYLKQNNIEKTLWTIERILSISPGVASELRERASLYERLGYTNAAAADYSRYLELIPDALDGVDIKVRLSSLLRTGVTLH